MTFDDSIYSDKYFLIKDSILINQSYGLNTEYKIERLSDKTFRLISEDEKTDSISDLEELLNSAGTPFYEITACRMILSNTFIEEICT
jgi:hypothetical protein